ncbi:MAG: penicillin-binding protein 2 [Candidatus Buchananbacteria bacterium]
MKNVTGADPFGITSKNSKYSIQRRFKNYSHEVDSFSSDDNNFRSGSFGLILNKPRINFWLGILFLGLVILLGRTAYLQLYQSNYFRAVAEGNRIRIRDVKAPRGLVYDRNMKPLVENIPSFSLGIIPVDLSKDQAVRRSLADELSAVTGQSADGIYQQVFSKVVYSYQPIIVAENLNQDQAIGIRILATKYSGVVLIIDSTRHYLTASSTESFSHVLGYQGKIEESKREEYLAKGYLYNDYVGKAGLELTYEKELKGSNGKEQVEVDATGQAKEILASQKYVSGSNLVLSIDQDLQNISEKSLKKILSSTGKKKGSVIVLDPKTGEILALVSLPTFDNNLFSLGISQSDFQKLINDSSHPLFNRSISGEYPPGSTFKLIVGGAALQENIVNENTTFVSSGGIHVNKWFFPDWKAGGHGATNIIKAIAESINTYFYIVGGGYNDFKGLGVDQLEKYSESFNIGKELGIDLPNEATGFVPDPRWKEETKNEVWYIGDTYHFAIGQGDLLATPLQVALWTSFYANGGKIYQPHVVKEILDGQNNSISKIEPRILNQDFISEKNIEIIKRGMRQTVLTGSGKRLSALPVEVAAKTGTAQWSSTKLPQAWFTAFAPYHDPEIVITVLVEEGGEGSSVALPVAYDIFNWWAAQKAGLASTTQALIKK